MQIRIPILEFAEIQNVISEEFCISNCRTVSAIDIFIIPVIDLTSSLFFRNFLLSAESDPLNQRSSQVHTILLKF